MLLTFIYISDSIFLVKLVYRTLKTYNMKKEGLKEQVKDILKLIGNIFLSLLGFALFATITALIGKLINYSLWSLLIIDIIFIFSVYKFINEFYYSEYKGANKKEKKIWLYFLLLTIVLGVTISIGVSLVCPWAILNIIILIFLFFISLVVFGMKREKNSII